MDGAMIDGEYIKPDPLDPRNLQKRLSASGVPINRGIAALINAPSVVTAYSCQGCGQRGDFEPPVVMTRQDVHDFKCEVCGSNRVSLNLRGMA